MPMRVHSMGVPMTAGLGEEVTAVLSSLMLACGRAFSTSWIQAT